MYVVLLILGFLLAISAIATPVTAFIRDRIRGRRTKFWVYLIVALILAAGGIVLIIISAPHVFVK